MSQRLLGVSMLIFGCLFLYAVTQLMNGSGASAWIQIVMFFGCWGAPILALYGVVLVIRSYRNQFRPAVGEHEAPKSQRRIAFAYAATGLLSLCSSMPLWKHIQAQSDLPPPSIEGFLGFALCFGSPFLGLLGLALFIESFDRQ